MKYKVGFGFDTHRLSAGLPMTIGGVTIEHTSGLEGHSDADLLIHAIIDALFSAADMQDIGYHFPDTDPRYKGIKSTELLKECINMISEENWQIENLACTVVIQKPKILPYIPQMKQTLAQIMQISTTDISINAKTSEHLGFIGREEGASAHVVALLKKKQ